MLVILACILLCAAYIGYRKSGNYLAPIVVSSTSWGIVLFLYATLNHGLFSVSSKCIGVIFLWNLFLLVGILFGMINVKQTKFFYKPKKNFNRQIRDLYFYISTIGFIPSVIISYKQVTSIGYESFAHNLRMVNTGFIETEYNQGVFAYVYTFAFVSYLIELLSFEKGKSIKRLLVILCINIIFSLITMAKSSFMFLLFTSIVIMKYKVNLPLKKMLQGMILILLLMSSIQLLRSGNNDKESVVSDMFYGYLLGGVPALDQILQSDMHSKDFGQHSLVFINNVYKKLGYNTEKKSGYLNDITDRGYLYVPLPTNVYTMIGPFWLDFGYWGVCIFGFIIGMLSGFFFRRALEGEIWGIVLYSYFCCVLILQFFGEYIFTNFSYLIQLVLLSLFAYKFNYKLKW